MKVGHEATAEISWVELVAFARKQFAAAINLPEDEIYDIAVSPGDDDYGFSIVVSYKKTKDTSKRKK